MNCVEVEKYFTDLSDNSLDPERLREIKDHLAACSRCSEELAALAECRRLVSGLPPVEPPVGFTSRVMVEVRDAAHRPNFWQRLFLPLQIKLPLQATAVVLISVLAAYIYQKESRQREPATTVRPASSFRNPDETDKLPPSAAQAPGAESKIQVPDEAAQGPRLKSSAQPEQPRSLAEPEEQNKRIDGVRPGARATAPSEEPGRSPAPSPLQKQSSTASEAASPRREQASPSAEAHAPPASAAVPQFDKDASLSDATAAGNLSSSSAAREKRASTSLDALKSGRAVSAFPAAHELTLRLKEPARDDETAAAPLESERPQAQPRPSPPQSEYKDLDQARQRAIKTGQSQTVWATIAASQYDGFKKELAGLGNIESELPAPAEKNDARFADQLRIKVTILPPLSSADPPSSR